MSPSRNRRRLAVTAAASALLTLAPIGVTAAQAQVTRVRQGSATDVSRTAWSGPAYTMNGSGGIINATMTRAIDAIRGGTGSIDVAVIAASGSGTPECDVITGLAGVNSCTTLTLTAARDGNDTQVNTDIRNAEFVYFAGGNQCNYVAWKGTALEASVESVVAKGGGVGGGSAGLHINSDVVYDACTASTTSATALADPYDRSLTFITGMFRWPNYANTINDSHFVTRDRMGRTFAFVARALKDGLVSGGKAWGVGIEEGASIYIDKAGLGTLSGPSAYVVLGDHQPEVAVSGQPLTYSNFKIWKLTSGQTYNFANRPTCGYYLKSVNAGVADASLYSGTPVTDCSTTPPPPTGGSSYTEVEPNDTRSAANSVAGLTFPATLTGDMKASTDRDYYALTVNSGQTLSVSCAVPSAYDADLYLLDSSGSTVTRSVNNGAGADESASLTRTTSGSATYYVDVEAYSGSGTADYTCTVTKS
ncbi:pre-peptidase C-terminal domain-containing protein [Micromonospora mirobrigensis]|uniref:Pre-peptidase C-terminal domain-containing protein n=1 Tax=Micromonospora mirobrigensis TaxID=262898 RepID=A0A1C4V662_9ACTN|nr:pre-peptidase C-terminal domain-containing protein [Micromonospora mirobrigensis]SCE79301.1 pre-peptidase C-terminal domain-containing protein [Micromonospora mirobrigensis]